MLASVSPGVSMKILFLSLGTHNSNTPDAPAAARRTAPSRPGEAEGESELRPGSCEREAKRRSRGMCTVGIP